MKCQKCGFDNKDGSRFCLKCGNRLLTENNVSPNKSESEDKANVPEQTKKTVLTGTDNNLNSCTVEIKTKGKNPFIIGTTTVAVIGVIVGIVAVKNNALDNNIAVSEITDSVIVQTDLVISENDETTGTSIMMTDSSNSFIESHVVNTISENGFTNKTKKIENTFWETSIQQTSPCTDECDTKSLSSSEETQKSGEAGIYTSIPSSEIEETTIFEESMSICETTELNTITADIPLLTEKVENTTTSPVSISAITTETTAATTTKAVLTTSASSVPSTEISDSGSFVESRKNQKYKYDVYTDHIVITKYKASGINVTIPDEIEGLPVTEIAKSAFERGTFTKIIIPDTVIKINAKAFNNCSKLKEVKLGKNVKFIGDNAFSNCKLLSDFEMGDKVEHIGKQCFYFDKSLKKIHLPDTVEYLGAEAFNICTKLADFNIPPKIEVIKSYTFSPLKITKLRIPGTVKKVEAFAFDVDDELTDIYIEKGVEEVSAVAFHDCRHDWSWVDVYYKEPHECLVTITLPEETKIIDYYPPDSDEPLTYNYTIIRY